MFDMFDEEMFLEAVYDCFSVLDRRYVADQCKELQTGLTATFDDVFETTFVIIDRDTGKPMNVNAVLTKRDAAEEFLKIVGSEKFEIGILLKDK